MLHVFVRLDRVHVGHEGRLVNRTRKMLRVPSGNSTSWLGCTYWCVPSVTIGLTVKFSVGGGDGISHSSPLAPHGSLADFSPATSE